MTLIARLKNAPPIRYLGRHARAKRLLDRSQKLFDGIYEDYWSGIARNRDLAEQPDWFDRMAADGICIVPNYIDADTVASLRREIDALPGFHDGTYDGAIRHKHFVNDGIFAVEVTDALPTASRLMKSDTAVASLARALYGDSIHLTAASVLNKYNPERIDSSNVPHWDDWRARFKAFLYVTDVGEENAPMLYIKGSHKAAFSWRREKDFASAFLPMASAGGSWWPVEQLGLQKMSCTGPAGTLVLFDALGIHSGTQLRGAARVMLMSMYTTHIPYGFRPY
jgi:hypothetical protein